MIVRACFFPFRINKSIFIFFLLRVFELEHIKTCLKELQLPAGMTGSKPPLVRVPPEESVKPEPKAQQWQGKHQEILQSVRLKVCSESKIQALTACTLDKMCKSCVLVAS